MQISRRCGSASGFGDPEWLPSWPSSPWSSLSLSLCEGRGRDDELLGRALRVEVPADDGRDVREVEATPPPVLAERLVCGRALGLGAARLVVGRRGQADAGGRAEVDRVVLRHGSALGTIVSAEPIGVGPVGTRTLVLSAAAVPPATSTAATVSAATAADLDT
ncbi:MAG: hypothetical protein U0R76_14945 [Candidatus Nanopelagicales bacterium]